MKVLFLDCDGVLNYTRYYSTGASRANSDKGEFDIDPKCIERVIEICNETDAKIVVSSDWKISWPGAQIRLENAGIPEGLIIGKTPDFIWMRGISHSIDCSRGAEINEWLRNHPECDNFVILDDRSDFKDYQLSHFVHIDPMDGLTNDHVVLAIQILKHH